MNAPSVNFGKSQFKGKEGLLVDVHRWCVQFVTLVIKNFVIFFRRPLQLFLFIALPSCVILTFLLENAIKESVPDRTLYPATPLEGLGECDSYYPDECVQIVYGPRSSLIDNVMQELSTANDLTYGLDVRPFDTTFDAQVFVSNNIGKVQFTVLFQNSSLWESIGANYNAVAKNMSYVIFYNSSVDSDPRSDKYGGINFPVLVLQKQLDEAYLKVNFPSRFEKYEVSFGNIWAVSNDNDSFELNTTIATNSTGCDYDLRPGAADIGSLLPWVLTFCFLLLSNISFQMVAEERRKKLFQLLRRLGLLDSAYWCSWLFTFEVLLVIGCCVALFVCSLVWPYSSMLGAIDPSTIFLVLWLSGTASVAFSCFLGSLCSTSSAATAISFAQFLVAMITIVSCGVPLNSYGYSGIEGDTECYRMVSSYNTVYSPTLLGYTFVQFLVFFLPWFHAAECFTDIISVVQYKGIHFTVDDITDTLHLTAVTTSAKTFLSKWIGYAMWMLVANTVFYMLSAWLAAQLLGTSDTEGRPMTSVLLPRFVRRMLFGEDEEVLEGDIRGKEQELSRVDKSIRSYKVSKTYSGVQALKEVSFEMKRGEVFVLLGHNGAGKSTLINILTGLIAPTHGKVYLSGYDIENDAALVQQIIGVCPQDDLLWDDLTAREHMFLTAAFKGLIMGSLLTEAVKDVLHMVQLERRSDEFAKQYSGGMKRRLSVAMSTVGDVEIIFFDEPTTGLDPVSRRHVWNAINLMKKDKVVVLTTHNMEEADYLADTIMIMHSGHVRAFGDPLFLKQTYGKGYQVNLMVNLCDIEESKNLVVQALPSSQLYIDSLSGEIQITVPKGDLRGLPRLFAWLESSRRAKSIIKEWGVSNTTLEQVFLMLCVQNTEINNASSMNASAEEAYRSQLCPMCNVFHKETVFLRNINGKVIIVPDSICMNCSTSNEYFCIDDESFQRVQAIKDSSSKGGEIAAMLAAAQSKCEEAATQAVIASEQEDFNGQNWSGHAETLLDGHAEEEEGDESQSLIDAEVGEHQEKFDGSIKPAHGTFQAQIHALFIKNIQMQYRQRCSNGCSILFVGFMFLMLYILSLVFASISDIEQCEQGYLTSLNCSEYILIDHIFSGSENTMVDFGDNTYDDDYVVPEQGYNIKSYVIPSSYFTYTVFPTQVGNEEYVSYGSGLSYIEDRQAILWSSMFSDEIMSSNPVGLSIGMRSIPEVATGSGGDILTAPNEYMHQFQVETREYVLEDTEYPSCPNYAPETQLSPGNDFAQNYSDFLADAVFVCDGCGPATNYTADIDASSASIFFNGTMWVTQAATSDKASARTYPYGFLNYVSDATSPSYDYLSDSAQNVCPVGIDILSMTSVLQSWSGTSRLLDAMSYLNMLSNTINNVQLESFPIQTAFSPYGSLIFAATFISQIQANFLTILSMMLLNGFWPIAVWRLAHEKSENIVLMMRTVGLRGSSYIFGMFVFDMLISIMSGTLMIVFAVELELSRFKGAPIGYLVAIVVLSGWALNSMSVLATQLLGKHSSVLTMVAPCLCIATAVAVSLVNIMVYPNDGDFQSALSLIPFFAQGRALYIILVYHRTSEEVDIALTFLFLFGAVCLGCSYIIEANVDVPEVLKVLKYACLGSNVTPEEAAGGGGIGMDGYINPNGLIDAQDADAVEVLEPVLGEETVAEDEDVAVERSVALGFAENTADAEKFAIVIQQLRHVFKATDNTAVKDLSVAMPYGEVFGLLGPNGAGKSVTISILCGTLTATGGRQYVAGKDIKKDLAVIQEYVGVCPQFDVVWKDLTVAEHLAFQARQRGIPSALLRANTQQAAHAVGLDGDAFYTKAGDLSGGMRRRLSIAMSIVGNPPIIFMDGK